MYFFGGDARVEFCCALVDDELAFLEAHGITSRAISVARFVYLLSIRVAVCELSIPAHAQL